MNKTIVSRRLSAASLIIIFSLLISLLPSCSGSKTDTAELLATVPADASAVAALNLKSVIEKTGCKIEGSKIVPGKEVAALVAGQDRDTADRIRAILNGETGVDPSSAIFFVEGSDFYITGFLADPDTFRKYISEDGAMQIASENGIDRCGNTALKGNQFWIRASHRNDIDPAEIARFSELSEKTSFLSNAYSSRLAEISHDIEGWGNLAAIYNASGMSFRDKTMAGLGLAVLFSDARDLAFNADFENGRFISSLSILNSKGEPAKFNFPSDRIDPAMVKELSGSADTFFAMALTPALVKSLEKELGDKNIPGAEMILSALGAIDGTCAVAANGSMVKGAVSTTGENTADLTDFISSSTGSTVIKDGKILRFNNGEVNGTLEAADIAPQLKGAMFALVTSGTAPTGQFTPADLPVKYTLIALSPSQGSMEITSEIRAFNEKENILLTFLKAIK
ncbi:MAG: DUF4836 family protein [Muribaculaceae bacterium]|nr:DUF4836 family protein [Muribaculaceae bacterium]